MKHLKKFEGFNTYDISENWKNKLIAGSLAASTLIGTGCTQNEVKPNQTTISKDCKEELHRSVVDLINNNQIEAARNLVKTTDEENELYDLIRNNQIQAAREICFKELK